jgi:hypothetical protein
VRLSCEAACLQQELDACSLHVLAADMVCKSLSVARASVEDRTDYTSVLFALPTSFRVRCQTLDSESLPRRLPFPACIVKETGRVSVQSLHGATIPGRS